MTADHGNAEQMLEADGVSPHTAHTTNPVPLIVTGRGRSLRDGGELADLAPTCLELLGVRSPTVMTGRSPGKNGVIPPFRAVHASETRGYTPPTLSLPQPDLAILRKAQRGDERAFSIIVRTYETPVYNYVLRLVARPLARRGPDAGGLPPRLPGPPALLAALQVHDLALPGDEEPRARRAARERAPAARARAHSTTSPPLEVLDAPVERLEAIDAVWRAVDELNPDLKMALLLRDVVGLPYTEIADSLEVTLATVKWRIYKARDEVQLALAREGITFGAQSSRSRPKGRGRHGSPPRRSPGAGGTAPVDR